MKSLPNIISCIFVSIGSLQISAQTISVSDFGLKPDSRINAVPFVQKALEACRGKAGATLVFPKGRYDFWPHHCIERVYFESNTTVVNPRRLAILIDRMEGLTIDGQGSEFVFHDRMQPFTVDNSSNITICNVSVDWDIPLTAQALVVHSDLSSVDLQIDDCAYPHYIRDGYLTFVGEGWESPMRSIMEFDKNGRVAPQTGDPGCFRMTGGIRWLLTQPSKGMVRIQCRFTKVPAVGNMLVLRHSERDHAGVFVIESKNVKIEDFNLYHCAGLGILAQYSENLTFNNVHCVPNPAKGRILAGHDDGFHLSNCKGHVSIDRCVFHGLMDDPINVHGTSVKVIARKDDHTLRCKFMHLQSIGMRWGQPGDTVSFIDNRTLAPVGRGIIRTFTRIDNELFDLVFAEPVPQFTNDGLALENLTWTCSVTITNSQFLSCRARGLLVTTPGKVVISDNVFESSGSPILISGDANGWYESGAVHDVLITRNRFKAPCLTSMYQFCEAVISINPVIPQLDAATPPFHRHIVITDNDFELFDYPILYALSVDGLEFTNNRLTRSHDYEPFHARKDGLTFEWCRNVVVKGNTMQGDVLGKNIRLKGMTRKMYNINDKNFKLIQQ